MKKTFKGLQLLLIGLSLIFLFVSCGGNKKAKSAKSLPDEINFGILRVPNDETLAIAQGYFDKYFTEKGIKCNYFIFDSGVQANKALVSGSVDFATMGNTNAIVALAKEIDVEMIWIHEVLGEIEALAVKNGSGINEMMDLKGKKIATPFASTAHYILFNALKEEGIEDKVELLDMKTPEIVAAWERGDVRAAYTWQPSLGKLLEDGKILISSEDMIKKGYITANVEVVRRKFAEKYPELVKDFITAMIEAGNIYRENPINAAEIIAKELEISPEEVLKQTKGSLWITPKKLISSDYFGTSEKTGHFAKIMKDTSDFLKEQESIDNSPSQEVYNKYVNPLYIERSMK